MLAVVEMFSTGGGFFYVAIEFNFLRIVSCCLSAFKFMIAPLITRNIVVPLRLLYFLTVFHFFSLLPVWYCSTSV